MTTKDVVLETLQRGFSVQYKRVSVNELSDLKQVIKRRYQVHSDHHNYKFSNLYSDPQVAVDKFMEIYKKVRYNR